jgi:hypothetical protein
MEEKERQGVSEESYQIEVEVDEETKERLQ